MKKATLLLLFIVSFSAYIFSQSTGCVYGDCSDGYGKYVWESGDIYIGNWQNGNTNGDGTYTFNSGDK